MTKDAVSDMARAMLKTCMCHKTRVAARAVTRAYDDALRPTGLRATQVSVLAAVAAEGALSITALAEALGMERTTLTRNLRPLEEKGHVYLAPESRHRSRMLMLTAAGQAALHEALPLWKAVQGTMKRRLGEQGWSAVQEAVDELAGKVT
jgi:DNA-binding MarR family transcriptional regulator